MTDNTVFVLRTSNADGTSYGGFQWPASGPVKCDDWDPVPRTGGGLHGLLWGQGDLASLSDDPDALWQVIRVEKDKIVELDDMVKFPEGEVVYSGDMFGALKYIYGSVPGDKKTYCDRARLVSTKPGARNISSGVSAINTSFAQCARNTSKGYCAVNVSLGIYAINTSAGENAFNVASSLGALNACWGHKGINVSKGQYAQNASTGSDARNISDGDYSRNASTGAHAKNVSIGYKSVNTSSGVHSVHFSAGISSLDEARGEHSICMQAGEKSVVSAGEYGLIVSTYWDKWSLRHRAVVGYVGENGIKPNTFYTVENGKFVEVEGWERNEKQ